MKFLYKINSGYDQFRPNRIEDRLDPDGRLRLGWGHYLDSVEEGSDVWVYFKGPASHGFDHGVYAKGLVEIVDIDAHEVRLGSLAYDLYATLTDKDANERLSEVLLRYGQQVFVLPEELAPVAVCTIAETDAASCGDRRCANCATWQALPRIDVDALRPPQRLGAAVQTFTPAYWVIPPRSFLYRNALPVEPGIRRTSELFHRFKFGEAALAFPLALGMYEQLHAWGMDDTEVDAVVPIPLSPEKEADGELHRTQKLVDELSDLLGAPGVDALALDRPISKRGLQREGITDDSFEALYRDALVVDEDALDGAGVVLLVDDVCTKGSTLTVAAEELLRNDPDAVVYAATAGQMAVRAAVQDEELLLEV